MRKHVRERMDFIKSQLSSEGFINRSDLVNQFEISIPQASVDLSNFIKLNKNFMFYNAKTKRYELKEQTNG